MSAVPYNCNAGNLKVICKVKMCVPNWGNPVVKDASTHVSIHVNILRVEQ